MSAGIRISLPDFEVDSVEQTTEGVTITAHSIQAGPCCPECGQVGQRVHSGYTRHPRDLPCLGQVLQLVVQARRFFCDNPACSRQTFAEDFEPWLARYARRTRRVLAQVEQLSLATGGQQSAVLARGLGIPTSATTVIRHLRRRSLEPVDVPRVLGVDDWAMKKGKRYGTILVDLEAHRAIDLLPDRDADTFAAWLKAHPGVEIISRDRGSNYIDGANQGAPHALQVADRWHLLHNLREAVQELLETQRAHLSIMGQTPVPSHASDAGPIEHKKRAWAYNRQERYTRYEAMVELAGQGLDNQAIARELGVSVPTVRKYLAAGAFPEWQPRPVISKWLLPYMDYIQQRWNAGCRNSAQLWRELCQQGYKRSRTLVYKYVARLRNGLSTEPEPISTPQFSVIRRYSPHQASWLLVSQPYTLDKDQKQDLATIRQRAPELDQAYQLAQAFGTMVREQQASALQSWMHSALDSGLTAFRKFVFGLHRDLAAVQAALSLPWSQGQTEGQVNRLKLIKRQMYGRANFDLLRLRVLLRS